MSVESILETMEQQQWLEPVENELQKAVHQTYKAAGGPGRAVRNFLNGTWLGHPLHPALTDVPLGAWTATVVLDAFDERAADAALCVGLGGAACAAIAGLTDWQDIDGSARRIGLIHGLLNLTGVVLFSASLAERRKGNRGAGKALALAAFGGAMLSAWLGGNLVYRKKIGVDHTQEVTLPPDFVPVLAESELPEGAMRRVEKDGFRILLVRRAGRVHALGEVCSHLGGPLAEGTLEDTSVRCPWHGSRFSLEDGSVLDGPATHPQPCLEARVRDGRIEVRPCGSRP